MKALALFVLLCSAFRFTLAQAQPGCPDPQAINYNPAATANDGSCLYGLTTSALPARATLPAAVAETSGLVYTNGQLWTLNDSGNLPVLFRLDTLTGAVLQQVQIQNFGNVDWEDLAADAQHLYIGDFGNNAGNRRDLRILQLAKPDIGSGTVSVAAQAIYFSYPDQTTFGAGLNNHNFDCEAFFYFQDSLHLFTKNWADLRTRYYTVPAVPGTHVARLKATFNVNGLVTAASINPTGTEAALLGYNAGTGATFVWLLFDFRGSHFLHGNKRRIELPNALLVGQAEGIAFVSRYRLFVSNEQLASPFSVPPRLYTLDAGRWLAHTVLASKSALAWVAVAVYPNPATRWLHVQRPAGLSADVHFVLQNLQGRMCRSFVLPTSVQTQELELKEPAGVYLLRGQAGSRTLVQKVVIE